MTSLPASPAAAEASRDRRADRYAAGRFLWAESSLKRVRYCGTHSRRDGGGVAVKVSQVEGGRRAGLANLQRCGSTWACPVCSHKIAASRAADLGAAVAGWHDRGGRIIFATFTMRHHMGQRLADLFDGVSSAWGRVTAGRAWETDQETYGSPMTRTVTRGKRAGQVVVEPRIGFARVIETTDGKNGWHVHVHSLLFVRGDITGAEAMALGDRMFERWSDSLVASGFRAPLLQHGVDIRLIGPHDSNKVAEYFAKHTFDAAGAAVALNAKGIDNSRKLGMEVAGGSGKRGSKRFGNRTPFEILRDVIRNGEEKDLARWWEWEEASKGRRQLTWSRGLRDFLALGAEKTDDEITDEEVDGVIVHRFTDEEWSVVRWDPCAFLDLVELHDTLAPALDWLALMCPRGDTGWLRPARESVLAA